MLVQQISPNQYISTLRRIFPPLAGYYAEQKELYRFNVSAVLQDGDVAGIMFTKQIGAGGGLIKYIAVAPLKRRQGIASRLVEAALQAFWQSGIECVEMELAEEKDVLIAHILTVHGFKAVKSNITIINQCNDETRAAFRTYYASGGYRLEDRLLRRGFTISSFADAAPADLDCLRAQIGTRYPAYLDPFPADKQVVEEGSFIVIKNGDVVGYLALTIMPGCDSVAEVSCRACADEYQNTGVGIWPLLKTLLFVAKMSGRFNKVLFSIDATDKKLTNMIGKMPVSFPGSHTKKLVTYHIERPAGLNLSCL